MNELAKALKEQLDSSEILINEKDRRINNALLALGQEKSPAEAELLRRLGIQKQLNLSLIDEIQELKAAQNGR